MLKGRSALITGSTSGIGWSIAKSLAKSGARIMLHGRQGSDESEIRPMLEKIAELNQGPEPPFSHLDVSNEANCKTLIKDATHLLGKVDILINNVGIDYQFAFDHYPTDEWNKIIRLNMTTPFFLARAVIPQMYERGWGRLLHISSANGLVGSIYKAAFVASKHGLVGLSKVIALEAAGTGVTSNSICPGYTDSPQFQREIKHYAKLRGTSQYFATMHFLEEKQPTEEFVTPEQLGGLAVFLCSEHADQVTGADYSMDGGWTVQ